MNQLVGLIVGDEAYRSLSAKAEESNANVCTLAAKDQRAWKNPPLL
jgi:hypothetical protein